MIDPYDFLIRLGDAERFFAGTAAAGGVYGAYRVARHIRRARRTSTRGGLTIGRSGHQRVGISWRDATQHIQVSGVTGSGKSVLLTNLVLQGIRHGYGAVVVDPVGGELVDDIADRLPPETPVAVIDPMDKSHATGWNPFESPRAETDPIARGARAELVAEQFVSLMRKLYAQDWGGRLEATLHNACLTLIAMPGATPVEIPALLARDNWFRRRALRHFAVFYPLPISERLNDFWSRFVNLTDSEYNSTADPLTHKFERLLRLYLIPILGQSAPRDPFDLVNTRGGVLMVKGRQGDIGTGPSRVLSALVVAETWNRLQARRMGQRHPTLVVLDEAGQYLSGPQASLVTDMLTLGRKLGCVCITAYQSEFQLPRETAEALGNARTKIVLTSSDQDAKAAAVKALGEDPSRLPSYSAVVRRLARGGDIPPVRVRLLPPTKPLGTRSAVLRAARESYGAPLAGVWKDLEARRADWKEVERGPGGVKTVTDGRERVEPERSRGAWKLPTRPSGAAARRLSDSRERATVESNDGRDRRS